MKGYSLMRILDMEIPDKLLEEKISMKCLTFQQMYIELNKLLNEFNEEKVDRDSFLLYLSTIGLVSLKQYGVRLVGASKYAKINKLGVEEIVAMNKDGKIYSALVFNRDARLRIYRDFRKYYNFVERYPVNSVKFTEMELKALEEMVKEGFEIEAICLNLLKKPLTIYKTIHYHKFYFPGERDIEEKDLI